MQIILASQSPRRRVLLQALGLNWDVIPSRVPEIESGDPAQAALDNARRKAAEVARRFPEALVVAADTVVVCDGKMLGKPRASREIAALMEILSGREHQVITAVFCVRDGQIVHFSEMTAVQFRTLTAEDRENYAASGEGLDKAGGYGIQGIGALFVEKITGCYYNVVGLPLPRLMAELKHHFGLSFWQLRA